MGIEDDFAVGFRILHHFEGARRLVEAPDHRHVEPRIEFPRRHHAQRLDDVSLAD
jgi:hypothetical protein